MRITKADLRRAGITIATDAVKRKPAMRPDRYRSRLERDYAARLEILFHAGEVKWWAYECLKLRIGDGCFYTPDFLIVSSAGQVEAHEVKGGFEREAARVRLHVAAEQFFFIAFVLVKRINGQWKFTEIGGQRGEHS